MRPGTVSILVHAAQSVAEPGAEAGTAGDLAAGLNIGDGGVVVNGLGEGGVDNAEVLDDGCCVGQQFADPDAAVVVLIVGERVLAGADRQRLLAGGHTGDALAIADVVGCSDKGPIKGVSLTNVAPKVHVEFEGFVEGQGIQCTSAQIRATTDFVVACPAMVWARRRNSLRGAKIKQDFLLRSVGRTRRTAVQ